MKGDCPMSWEKAIDVIWNRFCELDDEKQIAFVESSFTETVFIFPTSTFNDFCKNTVHLSFAEVAEAVADGMGDGFDMDDPWCMYDPIMKRFTTDETPAGFVENFDVLAEILIGNKTALIELGFTEAEIAELDEAYDAYDAEH